MGKKSKKKGTKTARDFQQVSGQGHSHGPAMNFEGPPPGERYCDKEDCGVKLEPGRQANVCERHELAMRAIMGRYLMPGLSLDHFQEMLASAQAHGYQVDWQEIAKKRELATPDGWICARCGGTMQMQGVIDKHEQWMHLCNTEAVEQWMHRAAQQLLGSDDPEERARVVQLHPVEEAECDHETVVEIEDGWECVGCDQLLAEKPQGATVVTAEEVKHD